jgi:glycosyltransferase involved in cell wall biosynthesis
MVQTKLSVLVPTYNCQAHLRECLESVKWADEILIVDSFSTDATLTIAREYAHRIVQHEYINSAKQKNWAIPQATYDWILLIDSDELLEPALQQEIQALLADFPPNHDGFRIPRKNLVFGKWIKSCRMYPDYQTRLFRKAVATYQDKEVHAHIQAPGRIGTLTHAFIHHDFEDVAETVVKWGRYTRYEGDQMVKVGRSARWYGMVLLPLTTFFYYYLWTGGIREGRRGFYLSVMWSYYVFLKHARLWQLEWNRSPEGQKYWNENIYDLR